MHPEFFVGALLHGTAIAVLAFFVLFAASKAEGLVKLLGTVLGIWILVLTLFAVAAPMLGFPMMDRMHQGWMQQQGWHPGQPAIVPALPAPAKK